MKKIKKLLSNLVGFFVIVGLVIFVYQNLTGRSIQFSKINNISNLSGYSINLSSFNFDSIKKFLVSATEKQARKTTANIVDEQLTAWKNELLKGIVNESLEKDTGAITEKLTGDIKIALISDSHESFDNLKKTVEDVNKDSSYDLIIHLGDLSRVGEKSQLISSKTELDKLKIKYYTIPGDHDFWETVGPENYIKVFGVDYYSFIKNGWKLIFLDNADLENGLDVTQLEWLKSEIDADDTRFRVIFLHIPLYSTHSERRVMGGNDIVENQKKEILKMAREKNVVAVVAGDQHYFNIDVDPEKRELKHIVSGALTNDRNLQPARYGVLQLKQDGSVEVKDIEL